MNWLWLLVAVTICHQPGVGLAITSPPRAVPVPPLFQWALDESVPANVWPFGSMYVTETLPSMSKLLNVAVAWPGATYCHRVSDALGAWSCWKLAWRMPRESSSLVPGRPSRLSELAGGALFGSA